MAYATFTLTGKYLTPEGTAHAGSVKIAMNTTLRDAAGDVVLAGAVVVALDDTGRFTVTLPAAGASFSPQPHGFTVTPQLSAATLPPVTFAAPAGGTTLDMADFAGTTLPPVLVPNAATAQDIVAERESERAYQSSTYGLLGPVPSGDITGVTDRVAIQDLLTLAASTGAKLVRLRQAPESAPYWINTAIMASDTNYQTGLSIPSGVTLRGQGMDATWIRLAVNSVGQASGLGSNIIINGLPTAGTDVGCHVEHLTVDGNAANQTDLFTGVAFIRGRSHGKIGVRVKNVRGTANSGDGETFHHMNNACADITEIDCEAVGDAGATASGFASNGVTGITRIGCTAHGMTASHGFTDWKSALVSNLGCRAYDNPLGAGFNNEDCDQSTYSACHAGGKAGLAADGYPFASVNEVQTIRLGAATAGTVTITYAGQTTAAIAYNATAATVQSALEALSNIAPGDVVITGGPLPGVLTLTFGGTLAGINVAEITATPTGLTGGTVTIATTVQGAGALPANLHGFVMNGSNRLTLGGCTARFNSGNGLVLTNDYSTLSGVIDGGAYSDNKYGIQGVGSLAGVLISPSVECQRNTTANYDLPTGWCNGPGYRLAPEPSVPDSSVALVNPFPFSVTIYLTGGVISLLRIRGTDIAPSTSVVRLHPGADISLWYSTAPTWMWMAD